MPFEAAAAPAENALGIGLSGAATLGIGAGVAAAVLTIKHYVGQGRKAADAWVKAPEGGQNAFLKNVLEPASIVAQSDPEQARELVAQGWKTYLDGADAYAARGKNEYKVVEQNLLKTPGFIDSVAGLLGENPLDPKYTNSYVPGKLDKGVWGKTVVRPNLGSILQKAAQSVLAPGSGGGLTGGGFTNNPLSLASQKLQGNSFAGGSQGGIHGWMTPTSSTIIPLWRSLSGNNSGTVPFPPPVGGGGFETGSVGVIPGSQASGGGSSSGGGIGGFLNKIFGGDGSSWLPAAIGAGTSILGGILNSRAARNAAQLQSDAANRAADLQRQTAKENLDFTKQVYDDQRNANAPFLTAGTNALSDIQKLIGPGGDLSKDFVAPTGEEVRKLPGYQFSLDQANKALERATRGVTSGKTVKSALRFNNDYADTKYNDWTDRTLNIFQTNRANRLNPLFQLAGFGPNAVSQNGQYGQNASTATTNINSNLADNVGSLGMSAAGHTAAGNVGSTNALVAAMQQIANLAQQRQAATRSGY